MNIIADGNSYVRGANSSSPNAYTPFPALIGSNLGIKVQNFGVSGQTTEQMLDDENSQIFITYVTGKINILIVMEGGNDIYFHGSASDAFNNMKNYCSKARYRGFKVLITAAIHRNNLSPFGDSPTTYNEKLDNYNRLILADNSFYDFIIRPDEESMFYNYTSSGYDADGIHPNQTGQQKYADLFLTYIKTSCQTTSNN